MEPNKTERLTQKQKKIFAVITVSVLVLFMAAITVFIGFPLMRFLEKPEDFRNWIDGFGIWSEIVFIAVTVFQVIFAIIPGEPLELGAGYAFGFLEGTLLCMIATTLGGILVFLLVKKFGIRLVEIFFPIEKIRSLWFLRSEKRRNWITFLVFAIPGTPKDLLCYFVGLTDMKQGTWILISTVARIPSIVTSTVSGASLGEREYLLAGIALALTAAISIAGILVYKKIIQPKRNHKQTEEDDLP
ncbi:MAG: TVP38/TMEM64 family protein [Clostridia bacterium]|nr:TVP38/TMEM64 family protein [Clostridia bacterium]